MKSSEYLQYDALGLAGLLRRGEVSPAELLETAIRRVERLNPSINAVVDKLYDRARERIATRQLDGPFAGVPFLLKDMILYEGARISFGSVFLHDNIARESHEMVRRMERAGLVIMGLTNASELGLLPLTESTMFGPARNPWNRDHSTGGSSGGAAAAVAAGMVPMAHGSDGGGSIRIPASACAVFGLKPSRGRNPRSAADESQGLTVEHCLSISVRDSAAFLDATHGHVPGQRWIDPPAPASFQETLDEDPPALRIAFSTRDFTGHPAHPHCVAAVEDAARLCEGLGHHVEEAHPHIDGTVFNRAFMTI